MISLILTLFISVFSIGPANYRLVDQKENTIVDYENVNLVKQSVNYSGYDAPNAYYTYCSELANQESWDKLELYFGNIFLAFNEDYGDYIYGYSVNVSGLYINIPNFYLPLNLYNYDYMSQYVNAHLNETKVQYINIYNRLMSGWSSNPEINSKNYYQHIVQFKLLNGDFVELKFSKSEDANYVVQYGHYTSNWVPIDYDLYSNGIFADSNFTFTDMFYCTNNWEYSADAEAQYREGYQVGYNVGTQAGQTTGYNTGYGTGYQEGYQAGLDDADYNTTASTIFTGIFDVGLLPVNVFLTIFNFEVFGINISGIVSGILTLSVVIILIRFLLGGKKDD